MALGTSFERELEQQNIALAQRSMGKAYAPFRFRMLFADFVTLFK